MKASNLCLLLALGLSLAAGTAQARRPRQSAAIKAAATSSVAVPVVTRDNFVSLLMATSGFDGPTTNVTVQNNGISYSSGYPVFGGQGGGNLSQNGFGYPGSGFGSGSGTFQSSFLSNNQLGLLLRAINEARLPALAGKYDQKTLRDGDIETVTLTISDEQNRDRTFTIQNHGDTAPRAYYAFTARLRDFIALKFPKLPNPQPASAK